MGTRSRRPSETVRRIPRKSVAPLDNWDTTDYHSDQAANAEVNRSMRTDEAEWEDRIEPPNPRLNREGNPGSTGWASSAMRRMRHASWADDWIRVGDDDLQDFILVVDEKPRARVFRGPSPYFFEWRIYDDDDFIVESGHESTESRACMAAEDALSDYISARDKESKKMWCNSKSAIAPDKRQPQMHPEWRTGANKTSGVIGSIIYKDRGKSLVGAQVFINRGRKVSVAGKILSWPQNNSRFSVVWEDREVTREPKSQYQLVQAKKAQMEMDYRCALCGKWGYLTDDANDLDEDALIPDYNANGHPVCWDCANKLIDDPNLYWDDHVARHMRKRMKRASDQYDWEWGDTASNWDPPGSLVARVDRYDLIVWPHTWDSRWTWEIWTGDGDEELDKGESRSQDQAIDDCEERVTKMRFDVTGSRKELRSKRCQSEIPVLFGRGYRKRAEHSVQVGDIFVASWGYDQTNVDFYQVTRITGASVGIRNIRSVLDHSDRGADYVVASPNEFIGDEMLKRVRETSYGTYVTINESATASLWDGKPKYETPFGMGH